MNSRDTNLKRRTRYGVQYRRLSPSKGGFLLRTRCLCPRSALFQDILSPFTAGTVFILDGWKCWLSSFLHRPSSNCRDSAALSDRTMIRRILQMRGKLNLFASLELGSLRVNIYLGPMLIQTVGFFDSRRAFCELWVPLLLQGIYPHFPSIKATIFDYWKQNLFCSMVQEACTYVLLAINYYDSNHNVYKHFESPTIKLPTSKI